MRKIKTKLLSSLMAGIMVFAMAPLGTGIAFADEENAEPAADATVSAKVVNEGAVTIDLTNGPITYTNPSYASAISLPLAVAGNIGLIGMTREESLVTSYDLDRNGTKDIVLEQEDVQGTPQMTIKRAETYSVNGTTSFSVTADQVNDFFVQQGIDQNMPAEIIASYPFFGTVTFVFPAKTLQANPLTLKAKTTKIKAKTLKKKAKTYAITKFITVNNAQGAVTYAKASGNKKITIAPNGTVTLKKKLKKGKYKVKVNVTATGNTDYDTITKTTTFTIKVK